jgi:hypothetical protein
MVRHVWRTYSKLAAIFVGEFWSSCVGVQFESPRFSLMGHVQHPFCLIAPSLSVPESKPTFSKISRWAFLTWWARSSKTATCYR